jgi:hypothetical protein
MQLPMATSPVGPSKTNWTGHCIFTEQLDGADTLCSDGDLQIDNNGTERSLRVFAVGRNNGTFFGSDNGGRTAAVLRSFVSSCELVRIDPFAWFSGMLGRIAEHTVRSLEGLLPHRWTQVFR